jgi:PAS domain S-box-containing protein
MQERFHLNPFLNSDSPAAGGTARAGDAGLALSQLLNTLPLAFFVVDTHHTITLASKQAADLWGMGPAHLTGICLKQFFIRVGHPEIYEAASQLLGKKEAEKVTFFALPQHKWIEVAVVPAAAGSQLIFTDVTATRAAAERQRALQQVLDVVPDLYLILSAGLTIEMVSDAYLAATRTHREDLEGQNAYDWLRYAQDRQGEQALLNTLASFQKVLQTKKPDMMPVQHYNVPGEKGQLELRFWSPINTPVLDEQGQVSFIIHKVNDITDLVRSQHKARKLVGRNIQLNQLIEHAGRVEAESRVARRRLEEAQQIGHTGSFEWTSGSESIYWSDELYRIYGLAPQRTAMTLDRFLNYTHPEDREGLEAEMRKSRQQARRFRLSHRIIRADGEVRFLNRQTESFADAQGLVTTIQGTIQDITELKEAEAEIISGKALLQSVFDASANGIYLARAVRNEQRDIVDFEFRLTNQAFLQLLGQEATGKRYHDLYPHDQEAGMFDKLKKVVETGTRIDEELSYGPDNLKKWFHMMAVKLEEGVVVTLEDITPRKQQQEAITKHLSILQQSEDLARLGSWEYDVPTDTFLGSEGMYLLFGLPPGTAVSPEIYRQYAQTRDLAVAETIVHHIRHHQPFEETLRVKIGRSRKTIRIKAAVIPDLKGNPAKVLGVDLDITEVSRLEHENLTMKLKQQKKLMLAILEAQETERKRIAEGLHNGVGQLLYAAKLTLDQVPLDRQVPDLTQLAGYKQAVDQLLLEAISETRRISHALMPGLLEELGLEESLHDICRKYSSDSLDLQCQVHKMNRPLEKHLQLAVFRITQELANNIVKHAGASKGSIQLCQKDRSLALLAEDNGVGFTPHPGAAQGMGLKAIRDRVNLLNGTMEIDSQINKGTLISIYLPLRPGI